MPALWRCLFTPPEPLRLSRTLPRLRAVLLNAEARFLVGSREVLAYLPEGFEQTADVELLSVDRMAWDNDAQRVPEPREPGELAFLQYTSGSTGTPRGIMITHANVMNSVAMMHREDVDNAIGVNWLPPYHDFGLIAGVLLPVYSGRPVVTLAPRAFIERPIRWLQAISRHRGTTSGGPNFAFELCVRKIRPEDCEGLDLSCWKLAAVGAEPVRAETLDRFTKAFEPFGFRRETFLPGFGLAEAVLNVTAGRWFELPVVRTFSSRALLENRAEEVPIEAPSARRLVGCGRSWSDQKLAIVDPKTRRELGDGQIGEIWFHGSAVGKGYWNRPEETKHTFAARIVGNGDSDYLRTGDLGFLHEGELFVVGRLKELIIIGGRNYYPHDIEAVVARSHPMLKRDAGVAFSWDVEGQERLVIVQEARRSTRYSLDDVIASIRREVVKEYLVSPYAVILIAGGSLPKTSSGKPRRRHCRELFSKDRLEVLAQWRSQSVPAGAAAVPYVAPRTPLEEQIAAVWADVLHVERVGIHDNFFILGGDSLLATQLYLRLLPLVPGELPLERLLENPTVAALAELVLASHAAEENDSELAGLLDRLESMSEEEAGTTLAANAPLHRDNVTAQP